jgi:hypothetical protein
VSPPPLVGRLAVETRHIRILIFRMLFSACN